MDKRWQTYFERSGGVASPRYDESIAYFRQFERYTPFAKMTDIGLSPQGRTIHALVVADGKTFTPTAARKAGKSVVLIQNGIHPGEIEGKDACMLLLRDMLVSKSAAHLLKNIVLIVIPVLNVDGHERISPYNRPNQNGPVEMGWRTNSRNRNLNRDYLKADEPETRAFLRLYQEWLPDLFIDNHTTNGADYQYHITYQLEREANIDAALSGWGQKKFLPFVLGEVERQGFLTAPYLEFKEGTIASGIVDTPAPPRLSTGYTAAQNRLGLLVETHSLKPFDNRVFSTLAMNRAALGFIHRHGKELQRFNAQADKNTAAMKNVPLDFTVKERPTPFRFKGFRTVWEESPITGDAVPRYSSEPEETIVPYYGSVTVSKRHALPKQYFIPAEFTDVIDILALHGVMMERITEERTISVEQYRFTSVELWKRAYEGRLCADVTCTSERKSVTFPAGTVIVTTNQRTNRVIAHLFEPEGPDSFVSWGFFNAFFERKEYAEAYVMEPIAQQMMKKDAALRKEFFSRLKDESFRNDPSARLDFFYQRSPYFDINERRYPIYRSIERRKNG